MSMIVYPAFSFYNIFMRFCQKHPISHHLHQQASIFHQKGMNPHNLVCLKHHNKGKYLLLCLFL